MHKVFAMPLDGDPLEFNRAELQRKAQLLADAQDEAGCVRGPELVLGPRDHVVGAEWKERAHEGT